MKSISPSHTDSSQSSFAGEVCGVTRVGDPWLTTLAHELRDPLTAVLLSLDELRPLCAGKSTAGAARDAAEHSARHMARIISDILALNRGRDSSQRFEPLDLSVVVAGAIEIARPIFAAAKHRLSVRLPPEPVRVRAHPTRFQQILSNLLTNAAKFTEPGGEVFLTADVRRGQLDIRVRDTGIGIDRPLLPHIFEPKGPGGFPDRREGGGLGIGLPLVKSLVEMHGGQVSVRSEGRGKGAEFIVRMPVC